MISQPSLSAAIASLSAGGAGTRPSLSGGRALGMIYSLSGRTAAANAAAAAACPLCGGSKVPP